MWYIFYFISYISCILNMEEESKGHVVVMIVEIEHGALTGLAQWRERWPVN